MMRSNLAVLEPVRPSERAAGLRVALFSGNYNYTRDGANQALNRLVGHLEEAGAAVRVYSPTSASPAFEPRGELVSAPSFAAPGRPDYRIAYGLTPALRRDLRQFTPNLIHLSAPDILGQQARRYARRIGVPVVASLHTRFETYLAYYGLDWLRPAAERYLNSFYAGCDRVLAPSRPMADLLTASGLGAKARVWSRGVDRVQFAPARRDRAWRLAHGLADDDVAVLFLGRLVLEKGLDVFADSLSQVDGGGRRIRPIVIGHGPARELFEARLPGAVFTGLLTGDELGRAVSSAFILLNPSRTETFGNATLEAMAAGLVVVCAQAPSSRELIADGIDGVVVDDHAPTAYAAAITALVADPDRRWRLGQAARRSSESFDWGAICEAVLDVYQELAGPALGLKAS